MKLIFVVLILTVCGCNAKFHAVNEPPQETTFIDVLPPPDEHESHPHDRNGHCEHRKDHHRHGHNKHGRCLKNDI